MRARGQAVTGASSHACALQLDCDTIQGAKESEGQGLLARTILNVDVVNDCKRSGESRPERHGRGTE